MLDFELPMYDEDFLEAERLAQPQRLISSLLQGFSYDEQLIPAFSAICGESIEFEANAVVLLYNYRARVVASESWPAGEVRLRFMGVAEYRA